MIEIQIFGAIHTHWIVEYMDIMYLLTDNDIYFDRGRAYTTPDKLKQRYHVIKAMV